MRAKLLNLHKKCLLKFNNSSNMHRLLHQLLKRKKKDHLTNKILRNSQKGYHLRKLPKMLKLIRVKRKTMLRMRTIKVRLWPALTVMLPKTN